MAVIDSWDSLAHELLIQRLASGSRVRLTIITKSMAPFLLPGDRLLLAKVAVELLGVGDLVAIAAQPCPIVHRIVIAPSREGGQPLVTKGDAGATFDRLFPPEAVLGRVVSVQRNDKVLALTVHSARCGASLLAWLSCRCVSAGNVSVSSLRRVMFSLLRRTMYIVSAIVWSIGQRHPGC